MQHQPLESERTFSLLRELLAIPGPAGQEEEVRVWLRKHWQHRSLDWHEDAVGNITCHVGGKGERVIIVAHMDEIGFVVRHITADGFLLLDSAQGGRRLSPARRYMVGQIAQVVGRHGVVAEGVFAAASGHVLTQLQRDSTLLDYDDFFVDIGAVSRTEAEERGVHVGAGVVWQWPVRQFGTRIAGKGMDDRMLLAIMDLLLDSLDINDLVCDLWFAATVQEENGAHGARALGHHMRADLAIALDVGLVGDIPTVSEREYATHLGGGPTLVHKDMYIHYDQRALWRLADVAASNHIPFQHSVFDDYFSDAGALIDHGIPAVVIGVPTRYTHTAFEMVEESDIAATVALLHAFLTTRME
jgi:tetrahedral aminopeptidase